MGSQAGTTSDAVSVQRRFAIRRLAHGTRSPQYRGEGSRRSGRQCEDCQERGGGPGNGGRVGGAVHAGEGARCDGSQQGQSKQQPDNEQNDSEHGHDKLPEYGEVLTCPKVLETLFDGVRPDEDEH